MTKESALIVIASPADETLYFHQGLRELLKKYNITILCLTTSSISQTGKELTHLLQKLGITVIFKNFPILSDILPSRFYEYLNNLILTNRYNFVITYSPFKNKDYNLYQIQCFINCDMICKKINIRFGFFFEKSLIRKKNTVVYTLKELEHLCCMLIYLKALFKAPIRKYRFCVEAVRIFYFFISSLFVKNSFVEHVYQPPIFERHSWLDAYKSKINSIIKLNCYLNSIEFFYIRSPKKQVLKINPLKI